MSSRTLRFGEHELGVRSSDGDGDGPVFVLVHGLGTSHRYLARLERELGRSGITHSVDLPGFGGLPRPRQAMPVPRGAALLGTALDAIDVSQAVLVGHSMGAQVVTELAVQRPGLVSHLVLVGPVSDPRRAGPFRYGVDLARDALKEPPSGTALTVADYARCGPRWYLTELTAMLRYRTDVRLAQAEAPVLVIRGGDDPVARHRWCSDLAAAGRGTLVEVPGHRHLVQHSAPADTAAAVLELVGETPSTDGRRADAAEVPRSDATHDGRAR